ncbi:MAG: RteC domain-containing protein [Chitinophagaceae bacterium]|nr:RteC domain-containing protein [Chitinophagaceae bacterium]
MDLIRGSEQLYEKLKARLDKDGRRFLSKQQIEEHFDTCTRTVIALNELIRKKGFTSTREEISFFRDHKPRITSLQRYYILLYNHSLFIPDETSEIIQYLEKMLERLERFLADQHPFYSLCLSDNADLDLKYFTRPDKKGTQTPGEIMISDRMAHQMLADYIRYELETIRR